MKLNLYKYVIFVVILLVLSGYPLASSTSPQQIETLGINNDDISEMMYLINESLLSEHIQKIQEIGPHPTGSNALESVKEYIINELNETGLNIRLEEWRLEGKSGINIEATLEGVKNNDYFVIVSAHYDSVDISPGAEDDGSGVSVVLNLAKIMSSYSFNSSIRFVLFSGEEQGRLGSICYAKNSYKRGDKILGDLQLDGVGYAVYKAGGKILRHHSNDQSKWMVGYSQKTAEIFYDLIELEILDLPHVSFSDHTSFIEMGYDASYLFRYDDNPYYHTSEDKLEYMNMTYLKKVCRLTLGTLSFMAKLSPKVTENDLNIVMKGGLLSSPCQFYIKVENENQVDTANLTIQIKLKNILNDNCISIIKGPYNPSCNWSFNEEIKDLWEFKTMNRKYKTGFFILEVVLKGFNDDAHIYLKEQTIGIAFFGYKVFMIPKT